MSTNDAGAPPKGLESLVASQASEAESNVSAASSVSRIVSDVYHSMYNVTSYIMQSMGTSAVDADAELIHFLGTSCSAKHLTTENDLAEWWDRQLADTLWFSYRKNINPPIAGAFDSDTGWGCMVRTGQMMMAAALQRHFTFRGEQTASIRELFMDKPDVLFSIHRLVEKGERCHVAAGTWFNATTLALSLQAIVSECPQMTATLDVVVGRDGCVSKTAIKGAFEHHKGVLLLVPVRLGIDAVNEDCRQALLELPGVVQSLGIVGGKPSSSLYFVGSCGNYLLHMDPHWVQDAFSRPEQPGGLTSNKLSTHIGALDPSMLLCFYLRDAVDYDQWASEMKRINALPEYPMFSLVEQSSKLAEEDADIDVESLSSDS